MSDFDMKAAMECEGFQAFKEVINGFEPGLMEKTAEAMQAAILDALKRTRGWVADSVTGARMNCEEIIEAVYLAFGRLDAPPSARPRGAQDAFLFELYRTGHEAEAERLVRKYFDAETADEMLGLCKSWGGHGGK